MAAYISRTLAANNQKLLTISMWVKLAKVQEQDLITSYYSGSYWGSLRFSSSGNLHFQDYRTGYILNLKTDAQYKDTNAWYHIVANFDCSLSTPTAKLYVNGEEPSLQTSTIYSQNATTSWNTDYTFRIGEGSTLGGSDFEGVMSDVYFIQGYKYDASTFGETDATTGEWKPITNPTINYGGTGGNSCHLKFANEGNLDLDSGDNNLTFTTTGSITQTEDCPSNSFATMNPLTYNSATFFDANTNGNTTLNSKSVGNWGSQITTIGALSGKYYCEAKLQAQGSYAMIGICDMNVNPQQQDAGWYVGQTSAAGSPPEYGYYYDGLTYHQSSGTSFGNAYTTGDIIGIAMDLDNNKLYFSKNGTWQNSGDPTSGSTGTGSAYTLITGGFYGFAASGYANTIWQFNLGNGYFGTTAISSEGTNASNIGKFEYDVPTGYTALSTKGLNE